MAQQRAKRPAGARRERVAAMQAQAKRAERQRNLLWAGGAVALVVVLIVVLVVTGLSKGKSSGTRQPAPAALVAQVENVPASTLNTVGAGLVNDAPKKESGPPLAVGGKPQVVYVGAEYCPHCGAERWAMVNALSRFGRFSGLNITKSAAADGNVSTFSFYGSSYTSPYLVFTPTETQTDTYKTLQPMTAQDKALMARYNPQGYIPFVVYGGQYSQVGVSFDDSDMLNTGMTWDQVAAAMQSPSNPLAQRIDGAANVMTATICRLTGGNPGSVCNAPGVVAAAHKLAS